MGFLGLQRLMSMKREKRRRRQQVLARNGQVATLNKRIKRSQCVGNSHSQNGYPLDSIPYLPEDIWRHIHSLMPMRDAARAACLSRAFLSSWRCRPNLTLNWPTLCSVEHGRNFRYKIDFILRNHSGHSLKILNLNLHNKKRTVPYINSWLQIALKQGIEELTLSLYRKYNFPCSLLSDRVRNSIQCLQLNFCVFGPTAELGPLRSLTRLHLRSVHITDDELECLLAKSLSLQHLYLDGCNEIIILKIPCVLQKLNRLVVHSERLRVIESKAPNLCSIALNVGEIKLSLGEALQLKDMWMRRLSVVSYARAELPSIVPSVETLDIRTNGEAVNTPMLPTKFLNLKHLTIYICEEGTISPSYNYFSLLSFLDASPSLETFFLNVSQLDMKYDSVFGGSSHFRQLPEHRHDRLKRVEIIGFNSAKSLVELTCCIVESSVSLEHLTLDTVNIGYRCSGEDNTRFCYPIRKTVIQESSRTVVAIRKYIEDKLTPTTKLTVLEPCTRCHSIPVDDDDHSLYRYKFLVIC